MTPDEVVDLLALMEGAWPGGLRGTDPDQAVFAYQRFLAHLPETVVTQALLSCKGNFPPSAAELRSKAEDIAANVPDLDEVLATISRQIRAVGWCGKPEWPDPSYAALIRALNGWETVCARGTEFLTRDVMNLWPTISRRTVNERAVHPEIAERIAGTLKNLD